MDVKYLITVDASGATKSVQTFDGEVKNMPDSAGKAEKAHKSLIGQIALGAIAYKAATAALRFMKDMAKDSIAAAMEQERADKSLAASLEITGRPVKALTEHFKAYASAMQKATIYGDEEIQGAQALLIQLTNLDKDGIDRATKGTIGLASVMGMDLNASTNLVAKALSGNVGALSRYGIQVSKTGTEEEKRIEILDKLEQFYGRATADTETYGGKLAQLKNKYGDLQEVVGNYVIGNTKVLTSLNKLIDSTIYYLTLKDKLAEQQKTHAEMDKAWFIRLWKAAEALDMDSDSVWKLINAHKKNVGQINHAIQTEERYYQLKAKMKDQGQSELALWLKQAAARKKAEQGQNTFGDAAENAAKAADKEAKAIDKLEKEMKSADKRLEDWNKDIVTGNKASEKFNSTLDQMGDEFAGGGVAAGWFADNLKTLGWESNKVSTDMPVTWQDNLAKTLEHWNAYADAFSEISGGINQLVQAQTQKKQDALNMEYEAQRIYLEKTITDETALRIALASLDEEYAAKGEALRLSQGKKEKKIAYMQAVVSTAQAVANALATKPFIPAGLVAAATAGIMGALQIATIKATPLAKGAIFKQPTLLAGADGRDYQVAEPGSGGTEIVASPENIRKAIGGGGRSITLLVPIYIGGKKIQEQIIKIIEDTSQIGKLRIASKAVN